MTSRADRDRIRNRIGEQRKDAAAAALRLWGEMRASHDAAAAWDRFVAAMKAAGFTEADADRAAQKVAGWPATPESSPTIMERSDGPSL